MEIHKKQWEFLKGKFEASQLSHAYLFSGQEGIGKKDFVKEFIKFINCISPKFNGRENQDKSEKNCGECVNCNLIEKGSFPDLLIVKSINSDSSIKNEKDIMEIDVSQIRGAQNFLSYKSYYGGYKAVIIENAERMNFEAQSCLLKTLEEPKGKTIIVLISKNSEMLMSTILSRCQTIKFFTFGKYKAPEKERKTLQELLIIINSELATKFQYAKKVNLEGDNFNKILEVLQRYFRDLMLFKIGIAAENINFKNPGGRAEPAMGQAQKIIKLIETLNFQITVTGASPKLALEILLLEL